MIAYNILLPIVHYHALLFRKQVSIGVCGFLLNFEENIFPVLCREFI